jgi:8-oxo-dGTP pyrophosphatase MutT (NUDIX family)
VQEDAKFHIGIKALIINEKKEILLLYGEKNGDKFWDLPGGRMQVGESIEEALRRETEEELGVSGKLLVMQGLFDATLSNFKKPNAEGAYLMLIVYNCRLPVNRDFKMDEEHSGWKWAAPKEAVKLLGFKYRKEFLGKL